MERMDLAELARSIEARQARLADTVAELKYETKPKVVAGHVADKAKVKARGLVMTSAGAVRPEAIAAAVVAVAGIAAVIIFSRR